MLLRVAAAVRSVSALRHDVLFLAADSPLSVPDVESAADVATAVLEFEDYGAAVEADRRLDAMADRLAARSPVIATAPEHEQACAALRERDAAGYAAAVEALVAARREQHDEVRRTTLLQRLGAAAPGLASAWTALADDQPGGARDGRVRADGRAARRSCPRRTAPTWCWCSARPRSASSTCCSPRSPRA